jgi:hypothetical protein
MISSIAAYRPPPGGEGIYGWYSRLLIERQAPRGIGNHDDDCDTTSRSSLLACMPSATSRGRVIFCHENGPRRWFACAETFLHLYAWIMSKNAPAQRTLYEVMTANQNRKPYFDIDVSAAEAVEHQVDLATLERHVRKLANHAISIVSHESDPDPIYLVYIISSSHSEKKWSFHVAIQGVQIATPDVARQFVTCTIRSYADAVKKDCVDSPLEMRAASLLQKSIDMSVYKSTQQFRMHGCCKYGDPNRVKTFRQDLSTWNPITSCNSHIPAELSIFRHSLITDMFGCRLLTAGCAFSKYLMSEAASKKHQQFKKPFPLLPRDDAAAASLTPADIDAILADAIATFATKHDIHEFPFEIRDVVSSPSTQQQDAASAIILNLRRTSPSMCPVCCRVHDSENPYLLVSAATKEISFFCRRASTRPSCVPIQPDKFSK